MKTIYIAGPMTGIENFNREEFMRAEAELQAEGYITHNPVRIGQELRDSMIPEPTWKEYMAACAPHLVASDEIYLLKNWDRSKGALIEFTNAKLYEMPVRFQQ